jgi:hypothetical protein
MKLLYVLIGLFLWSTPVSAKTWAAQFPYGGGELSPVFHARSSDAVLTKATAFCKQNDLCKSQYTDDQMNAVTALGVVGHSNLFVTTLCRQDNGEQVYATVASQLDEQAGRQDGEKKGQEMIEKAGHSTQDCLVHAVYGVKSRGRLKANLNAQEPQSVSYSLKGEIRIYRIQRRSSMRRAFEVLD